MIMYVKHVSRIQVTRSMKYILRDVHSCDVFCFGEAWATGSHTIGMVESPISDVNRSHNGLGQNSL